MASTDDHLAQLQRAREESRAVFAEHSGAAPGRTGSSVNGPTVIDVFPAAPQRAREFRHHIDTAVATFEEMKSGGEKPQVFVSGHYSFPPRSLAGMRVHPADQVVAALVERGVPKADITSVSAPANTCQGADTWGVEHIADLVERSPWMSGRVVVVGDDETARARGRAYDDHVDLVVTSSSLEPPSPAPEAGADHSLS